MTQWFCDIADAIVVLSATGIIAREKWVEIPQHFPFVELDEFVVMPNHFHGIIDINGAVETLHATSIRPPDATSLRPPDATSLRPPDATSVQFPDATSVQFPDATSVQPPDATSVRPPDATFIRP
jgi:hypothetical protein